MNNEGLIYYCSDDDFEGLPTINSFHIYDINTGYKTSLDLNLFLSEPLEFQITDKYIYFREVGSSDKMETMKTVRFINPGISVQGLENILSKSFFDFHN